MSKEDRFKMNVVFFLGFSNPFPGAAWTRIGFFAEYLKSKGLNVSVVGRFSPRRFREAGSTLWRGVRIFNLCPIVLAENLLSLAFNVISSLVVLPMIFLILRPDVVIISVPSGEPIIGAYLSSKLLGADFIVDYRDEWEDYLISKGRPGIYRKVYRIFKYVATKIYMKADLVITVTQPLVESLSSRGIRGIEIIPNGANVKTFKPYNKAEMRRKLGFSDEFILVYSGFIGTYHRLDVVIEAFSKFVKEVPKAKLIILGKGPALSEIMTIIDRLGLKRNVIYLGVKEEKEELARVLSAADVGVIPYDDNPLWKNALPAKFFEYCACGLPVIATVYEDSVLANFIKKNRIGLTSKPMDVESLYYAFKKIYEDRDSLMDASRRARSLIEQKFDRNRISERFFKILRRLHLKMS
ncbi:MAG: glycosyltransferase family 4 protein [Candidatus Asgardarchaeia archaeon]